MTVAEWNPVGLDKLKRGAASFDELRESERNMILAICDAVELTNIARRAGWAWASDADMVEGIFGAIDNSICEVYLDPKSYGFRLYTALTRGDGDFDVYGPEYVYLEDDLPSEVRILRPRKDRSEASMAKAATYDRRKYRIQAKMKLWALEGLTEDERSDV